MDSTTVPPSSVFSPASEQDADSVTATLVARLAEPGRRADAVRTLARRLGADDLIIFTADPELPVLLPAPGFPQTLPHARQWHDFVAACAASGELHHGELYVLATGSPVQAQGFCAADGSVVVLLGGAPNTDRLAMVAALLPILAALYRHERAEETARGQVRIAQEAAVQARTLASALDDARRDLQQALHETEMARRRLDLLNAVSAALAASLDDESALARVARLLVPAFGEICFLDVLEENATASRRAVLRRAAAAHADSDLDALLRYGGDVLFALDDVDLLARAIQTRETQRATDLPADVGRKLLQASGDRDDLPSGLCPHTCLIVPLVARGRAVGVLVLAGTEANRRYYGPAEVALAEDVAARCALAVENARLYRHVQEAVRTRDEFLLSASHDLKTPLAAIQGHAQLIERRAARAGMADLAWLGEGIAQIQRGTRTMLALLDELLDVTGVQLGQELGLQRQPVDLVALARQVVSAQQQTAERHRLALETAETALVGLWDATRLMRVLGNLVSNAIKYSPAGGTITIGIGREMDAAGVEWAVLDVRDQGVGIPARDLPHIFDRFQRGSNVIGQISGTGVGLASARSIVERHGGTIRVESQEGAGSRFVVRLPVRTDMPGMNGIDG